jgi:hypothetical protein
MSYRTYIAEMPKREYNKIKSMNGKELIDFYNIEIEEDGSWFRSVYEFGKELCCLGTPFHFDPPNKLMKKFFKNKELQEMYDEDHDFYIVTKEFLAYIIDTYKTNVINCYDEMMKPFFSSKERGFREKPSEFFKSFTRTDYFLPGGDQFACDFSKITQEEINALFKMINHIKNFESEWTYLTPFDLDDGTLKITSSWKYEYEIFDLVRIYKSFDWKKNVMIYYGH